MRPNAVEILFEKFPTCWHSPKNGLRSVLIFGSGNLLIASVSSGSGLKLFPETTYPPNFTVCCANCNFLVFRDTSCSAARADRWRTASMCSSCWSWRPGCLQRCVEYSGCRRICRPSDGSSRRRHAPPRMEVEGIGTFRLGSRTWSWPRSFRPRAPGGNPWGRPPRWKTSRGDGTHRLEASLGLKPWPDDTLVWRTKVYAQPYALVFFRYYDDWVNPCGWFGHLAWFREILGLQCNLFNFDSLGCNEWLRANISFTLFIHIPVLNSYSYSSVFISKTSHYIHVLWARSLPTLQSLHYLQFLLSYY